MALYGWTGDNGDPDNFLHILLGCIAARPGGNNIAKWCDPEYDKLVTEAKLITDRAEREELYRQAQVIFHDAGAVGAARPFGGVHGGARERQGFKMDPLGRHRSRAWTWRNSARSAIACGISTAGLQGRRACGLSSAPTSGRER